MSDNSCIFQFACDYFKNVSNRPELQEAYYTGMASTNDETSQRCCSYVMSISFIMERIQSNLAVEIENDFARAFVEDAKKRLVFKTSLQESGCCELSGMKGRMVRVTLSGNRSYVLRTEYVGLLLVPAYEYINFYQRCRDYPFQDSKEMEEVFEQDERGYLTLTSLKR